jgi:energy-coupling factor transport system substrate-specific component
MRELITMWKYSRMVILVALVAAIYAAILIPFKAIPIIPGVTELRPGNVCPVIFGLLFGPAGAWGSLIGNFSADLFGGTLGIPSFAGIFGNFFMGLIPYVLWGKIKGLSSGKPPLMKSLREVIEYVFIALIASVGCGAIIGYILDIIGLYPFAVLGNIISINNFVAAAILGPILLKILYPRIEKWGLIWTDVMEEHDCSASSSIRAYSFLIASICTFLIGNFLSIGMYGSLAFGAGFAQEGDLTVVRRSGLILGLLPFIALFFISLVIPSRQMIKANTTRSIG